jgi:hypothetical protein
MPTFFALSLGSEVAALSASRSAQLSLARSRFLLLLLMKIYATGNDRAFLCNLLTGAVGRV